MLKESYEKFNLWAEKADESIKKELIEIKDDEKEIIERFHKNLEFGTGGMRGKIGAGTNRINVHNVARVSQAFSNYLKKQKDFPSIVIAYDNRHFSKKFAEVAAEVFAANNIQVHLFKENTAVPILSYAVRRLAADGGIVITASHNPPEYNGYKIYTSDGSQAIPEKIKLIIKEFENIDFFDGIKRIEVKKAKETEKISFVENSLIEEYLDEIESYIRSLNPLLKNNLKIVYSSLHGTGLKPVTEILKRLGFEVYVVKEQMEFDPNFSTVKSPNPEDKEAFEKALNLAEEKKADLVIATDPDADRIGIFERTDKGYEDFNGNEMGIMLSNFILNKMKEHMSLPENGIIIKTIVSTDMIYEIAKDYGVEVEETLTGFKFIGEKMEKYSKSSQKKYIFGFEESYGCLANTHARDKDAIIAAALIVSLASDLKNKNKNIREYLEELNKKYGYYKEYLMSFAFEGVQGNRKIIKIMDDLKKEPPIKIGDNKLIETIDYSKGHNNLPKSDVIELRYGKIKLIVRGSGTEPKIKFYILVKGENSEESKTLISLGEDTVSNIVQG